MERVDKRGEKTPWHRPEATRKRGKERGMKGRQGWRGRKCGGKKGEKSIKKKSRKNMSKKNSTEEGKWLSIRNERDEDERKGS